MIYKGKLPSTYLQVHLNRRDLKVRLVSLKFKPRMPIRCRKNSFRARCVPNTIFRTHRRNLGVPAPSSLGLPNPLLEGGSMASSSSRFLSSRLASSSMQHKVCSGGVSTPPRPLASPTPSPPHSCGGKGWDMNNPCEACISLAWSEQVGTEAQSQSDSNPASPFVSRSASASACTPDKDIGVLSPPPPLAVWGPRAPSSLSSPVGCSTHRDKKGWIWDLQSPCQQCLHLALEADL